MRTLTR